MLWLCTMLTREDWSGNIDKYFMRAHEFIIESAIIPIEQIEQIKALFDQGLSRKEIADRLDISVVRVGNVLNDYYKDRDLQRKDFTSDEINLVKKLFDQGLSFNDISQQSGLSIRRIEDLLKYHYSDRQKRVIRNPAATIDDKNTMAKMYSDGISLGAIAKQFDISTTAVIYHLKRFPNYDELKQKHNSSKDSFSSPGVTTKIYRPGEIGNARLQGPGSKHRRGTTNKNYF